MPAPKIFKPSASWYRRLNNTHILFWLVKDTCWALAWRVPGVIMIGPTLGVAFYLFWRSRHNRAEAVHNLSVCLWICANSIWMIGEFFEHESFRSVAIGLFLCGLLPLILYYLLWYHPDAKEEAEGYQE